MTTAKRKEREAEVPVLAYYQYLGGSSQTVYKTRYYCGSCRREIKTPYGFPEYPEQLEAKNETPLGVGEFKLNDGPLDRYAFCPWCGAEFAEEWWKNQPIQNERAIDHYQNPGTHKGDTHEFRGEGPGCMANHWLAVSGGDRICWCDPEVEPGLMGCVIRHQDKSYDDYLAAEAVEWAEREAADDDWDDSDD